MFRIPFRIPAFQLSQSPTCYLVVKLIPISQTRDMNMYM